MADQPFTRPEDADMRGVLPALERAAQRAREIARATGTAIVVMRDGEVVEERPWEDGGEEGAGDDEVP